MGSLCAKPDDSNVGFEELSRRRYSKEIDLVFSPGLFVTENFKSFYGFYVVDHNSLGSGAWGEVKKCTHKITGEVRVVKIISKADLPKSMIANRSAFHEVEILKKLDHPNLPRVYEFFEDDAFYYIVIELCKGGDLFDRILELKQFTEAQASEIMKQILLSVNYLHSKGIAHRDVKPENILMAEKNSLALKLVDFDTACMYKNIKIKKMYGTALYMAPEVLKGRYDEKCDLWSCGIIMYILLTGHPPYNGTDDEIFEVLMNFKYDSNADPGFEHISEEGLDLIRKLLVNDPKKRISASEACLHPWITSQKVKISDFDILDVLKNLQDFKKTSKLKEAIHTFIISQIADPAIFQTEMAVFHLLDENNDGTISKEEFKKLMISKNIPEEEAEMYSQYIMEEADSDRSGFVDYTEFLRASVQKKKFLTKENIEKAFRLFDQDQSDHIEVEELKKWLTGEIGATDALLKEIMEQVDKNGDGRIDLNEFESLLLEGITRRTCSIELSPVVI